MRRTPWLFALPLALALAACSDAAPDRLLEPDDALFRPAQNASQIAQIQTRINALFPQPEKRQASRIFAQVKRYVASGDASAARARALALIDLALHTELEDPRGPETADETLSRLLDELYDFVGLQAPNLDPALLEDDAAAVEVIETEGDTAVTGNGEAGAGFPSGAVDEPVLAVIQRVELQPGELCLPTDRAQREGCYQFSTFPVVDEFNVPVTVGLCFDDAGLTPEQADRFRLYKHDAGDASVQALENTDAGFVDCTDAFAFGDGVLGRFASAIADMVMPAPAYAADKGRGGLVGSFSRVGWAASTVLLYEPSIETSLSGVHTEETLAEDLGHFVVAVDSATWVNMSATGAGGFGDYDAIVIGEGGGPGLNLWAVESTGATWSSVVSGHIVVNALHSVRHHCADAAECGSTAPAGDNPYAGQSFQNALDWVAGGSLPDEPWTGFYLGFGIREFFNPNTPPGTPSAVLAPFGTFEILGRSGTIIPPGDPADAVTIVDAGSPVVDGLTDADLSYWFLSLHQFISAYPSDFTPVITGLQRIDANDPGTSYAGIVVREVAGASQHH